MIKKSQEGLLSVTLDNCFENYQDKEVLNGANQIYCNNCKQMSNATTRNTMFTCPQVMTIILNRGKGLEFEVIFDYPLMINIEKYVIDKSLGNYNYELICVLTHLGPSGMAGHFIAFCKSPVNGKWYCYNDANVSEIVDPRYNNNLNIEGIPYVLFYQKYNKNKVNQNNINNINNINNNSNNIILFFNYNDKQFFLDIDKNLKIKNVIKILNKQYDIPKNVTLFYTMNNDCLDLDPSKTIEHYNLEDQSTITVLYNN